MFIAGDRLGILMSGLAWLPMSPCLGFIVGSVLPVCHVLIVLCCIGGLDCNKLFSCLIQNERGMILKKKEVL
jgi:hypothetical protein